MSDHPIHEPSVPGDSTTVIFDVNETLSDMSGLGDVFERHGLHRNLVGSWFSATLRDGIALTAAGAYADFTAVARTQLGALLAHSNGNRSSSSAVEDILTAFTELPLHADVRPCLVALNGAGIRSITLTNASATNAGRMLHRAGLAHLVEANLSVEAVGRWKPAPEPYRYAVARLAVEARDAVLVAVHPWDVDGAKRAGLRAVWVNRQRLPYPEVLLPPDMIVGDLTELPRWLIDEQRRS